MFSTISSIRKPTKAFNMYHLEGCEIHVSAIRVKLFVDNLENDVHRVDGNLHLCSRSLFFEPLDITKPVFKLKFSNPLTYKVAEKTDKAKLRSNIVSELKEQGLGPFEKKSFFISLEKLYGKSTETAQAISARNKTERTVNALVITAEKIFTTLRDPITPYSSERVNIPLIFELVRENSVAHINKYLKLLDYVIKNKNEDNLVKVLVESQVNEGLKEIVETKKDSKDQPLHAYKARRILPEGTVYGVVTLSETDGLAFHPVINRVHHKNLELKFSKIKGLIRYRYMFRHSAIEIWSYNSKYSVLLDFYDNTTRETVFNYLKKFSTKRQENLFSRDYVTSLWLNGHLSNFEYLMFLNTIGNRSFNDLSQYPIFPWVISDFQSEKLNLNDPETFRDLSKPIGAINKSRLQRFKDGYEDQIKSKFEEVPYLYPTHYSTPGFVVYFLIRKIPEFIIRLQNGVFGPAERIFRSFESAWDMTVNQGPDLKELIPEFYFIDSDFLVNFDKILLGVTAEGELIDDVVLPIWAKNPSDFLQKMRAGLESDYVSSNLHQWIDLIFGCKQKGEQAIASNTLFYPLCYEENVDWNKYKSSYERDAVEIQVAEFGQVPTQVFDFPHPPKRTRLINIYKIPKELYLDDKEMLRGRIHGASQEIDKLKGEIEYLKHHYTDALKNQAEDFRKKEETKHKEFAKKLNEKQEEIETIKRDLDSNKERGSHGGDKDMEEVIARIRREYEDKIESVRLQAKYERNDYVKELEKTNATLKKKVKQYEDILQNHKEPSNNAGPKLKKGYENVADI